MNNSIFRALPHYIGGVCLALCIAFASIFIGHLNIIRELHISPLIIGICLGIILSLIYQKTSSINNKLEAGVTFSAKKILRLGIILYGFNVSLSDINNVGIIGILLSLAIVVLILGLGVFIGIKFLGLDKELAILVSIGSAICGAAAVLAMESALKSAPHKGIIAVGTVVVFGLIGMFLFPILYKLGFIPFNVIEEGLYIGISLHEVANVVGAGDAISQECATYALIVKMIRVMLLAPALLIIPLCLEKFSTQATTNKQLYIPWFAIGFLVVIIIHSLIALPAPLIEWAKFLSVLCLTMAMCALGLQIDFKKFITFGGAAFKLAFLLCIFLFIGGFFIVYAVSRLHLL
ncbi:putative sulfate exporter family transporter [Helicobacter aurati]|uniref:Putative sulfate exporter family transporter n=1 Tax=Helicobacter aurati TaxID=137778 RepID=A0A3D8J7P2_9HELI|nr:putative sulfate exporter family transporter [Helicobacter aurati]RDU72904.1 putative sulfate exporter family transporter [Helicobacter aurati]